MSGNERIRVEASTFVGGAWERPGAGWIEVCNPATGRTIASVAQGGAAEALQVVDAAERAFEAWAAAPARERADVLNRAAALVRQREAEMASLLARETGKRLSEAAGEVRFAAEYFQWFAEECRRPYGRLIPGDLRDRRHFTTARPAGVALCLTPWNFPVSIQARKVAPALAAGCTVVSRPSARAPLAVIELFRCLQDAGIPPGVANLVHGSAGPVSEAMIGHRAVRVISFTGSTDVGRRVMHWAADRLVRVALELGGNAPFIVFDDADLDRAVDGAMIAKFRNNGQSCIAANRFYVQSGIAASFARRLAERVDRMRLGDPLAGSEPDLGPLIDADRRSAVEALVGAAETRGARRLTASHDVPAAGFFTRPVLLGDLDAGTPFEQEEIFGPAAGIFPFDTESDLYTRSNATEMALAAYVYTRDVSRAWRASESVQAGILGLNNPLPSVAFAPMGGAKQSGFGREGGRLGIEEFLDPKYVCLDL